MQGFRLVSTPARNTSPTAVSGLEESWAVRPEKSKAIDGVGEWC